MFVHFDPFFETHDPRLLALAGAVCLVAAHACMKLLRSAQRHKGRVRFVWIGIAAMAAGLGIWASHLIAIMSWQRDFPISFAPRLIDATLIIAIGLSAIGIAMALRSRTAIGHFAGGMVIGLAIICAHYTSTAALLVDEPVMLHPSLLALAMVLGPLLAGGSLVATMRNHIVAGGLLLSAAIYSTHVIAMTAMDYSASLPLSAADQIKGDMMMFGVTIISLLVLAITVGSVTLDEADRRRVESEHLRQVADADRISEVTEMLALATTHMAQGLCLFDASGHMRFHNSRLAELIGPAMDGHRLTGWHFRRLSRGLQATAGDLQLDWDASEQRITGMIAMLGRGETLQYLRTMTDGRILHLIHSPIAGGGWVTTLDDVTEQQRAQAEISRLAYRDSLTNILNRAAFNDQLDLLLNQAHSSELNFAVVAIDLDRFKEINDTYGHAAGDQVLKTLGTGLSAGLKEGEVVARMGGDEFAALKTFTSMESLREFLARIEAAMFARVVTEQVTINTAASIGVAIFPDDGSDRSRLLNNADLAMYRAKADIERRVCYYEKDMDEHARQRRSMAQDLWVALETDGFHLVYQVQKSVETNRVTGFEVLLRWDRPGYGLIPPSDFIPIAEESGAISAIGAWVLHTACRSAASWPEPHKIAVNVSSIQLGQVELIETVRAALLQSGLAPSRLELEVTETAIIADKQRALHILRQIKAMGVSIAIDDFGTGYSSLDTLRTFPFDKIKIDRSFMAEVSHNAQSRALVRAILALGQSLSISVLAEGVETADQLEVLRAEGCNEAQGFLLGRPGAIEWVEPDVLLPRLEPMAQITSSRPRKRR